jgi:hypothetical protein
VFCTSIGHPLARGNVLNRPVLKLRRRAGQHITARSQGGEQYWMTRAEQHFIATGRGDLIC